MTGFMFQEVFYIKCIRTKNCKYVIIFLSNMTLRCKKLINKNYNIISTSSHQGWNKK